MKKLLFIPIVFSMFLLLYAFKPPVAVFGTVGTPIVVQGTSDTTQATIPLVIVGVSFSYDEGDTSRVFIHTQQYRTKVNMYKRVPLLTNLPTGDMYYNIPSTTPIRLADVDTFVASYYRSLGYGAVVIGR